MRLLLDQGVILIRIQGLKATQVAQILVDLVRTSAEELEAGAAVSVNEKRARFRRLPVGEHLDHPRGRL